MVIIRTIWATDSIPIEGTRTVGFGLVDGCDGIACLYWSGGTGLFGYWW